MPPAYHSGAYHLPGRCIAHGTMLYRYDPEVLSRALTPSRAKLESKGVQSVHSRVSSLVDEGGVLQCREYLFGRIAEQEKIAAEVYCLYRVVSPELYGCVEPSRAKLESKGVQSVHSRVSSLVDEGLAMSPAEFEGAESGYYSGDIDAF